MIEIKKTNILNLKKILKKYRYVLVELKDFPNKKNKNIIKAKYFDDLLNAKGEKNNPIYYVIKKNICSFILLDGNDYYIYSFKNKD